MITIVPITTRERVLGNAVKSLFNHGEIPRHLILTPEIPEDIFGVIAPERDYSLIIFDEPESLLTKENIRYPSIGETMWAIGFMPISLAGVIAQSEKPLRFLHVGFRVKDYRFHMFPNSGARQIVLEQRTAGYIVRSVHPRMPYDNFRLVYVRTN